jgi:predicted  nucleic acid-binding Zn-ribbon protein
MEQEVRKHIEDLEKEITKIETKIKKLVERISSGTTSDKDVANLVELSNQIRERKFAIFNLYQILGKVSQ